MNKNKTAVFTHELMTQLGFPTGALIGAAVKAGKALLAAGDLPDAAVARLAELVHAPERFDAHPLLADLAAQLTAHRSAQPQFDSGLALSAKPYTSYGVANIDPAAISQMDNAMRLPVSVAGALMPDAHVGYGLPIGGVLATEAR